LKTTQLKSGYWDQNIRNPGSFLARDGGVHYAQAWNQVHQDRSISRAYVESFNEYDEGSGIYAANPGPPYVVPPNPNTDVWSNATNPYEYIETTASGARLFNDTHDYDAIILSHDLPTRMSPGETRTVPVIVRNTGDVQWTGRDDFRFGQKLEDSDANFSRTGFARWLISDADNEIPTYGGIFRGRPLRFDVEIKAPTTPGIYTTRWGMLQEGNLWFGETLDLTIRVQVLGDMDNDADADLDDIQPFVIGLTSPDEYQKQFGFPPAVNGDTDGDDDLDFDDIDGFVALLTGGFISGRVRPVPEASALALTVTSLLGLLRFRSPRRSA
jgi:hypothetical protein